MRYSLENPLAYVEINLTGFTRILEACRHASVPHLVFASTSSVYGGNTTMPFTEAQGVDHPAAVLRRHQAGQRADGACLRASLPAALHRPAVLHRLRPLGPARHGADALRQRHRRRAADQALQRGPAQPRLHLCRRHRRGGDPGVGPPCPARSRLGPGRTPTRPPRTRPSGSTTSATAPRSSSPTSSRRWSRRSAARRSASSCRCSPATCPTPSPIRCASPAR